MTLRWEVLFYKSGQGRTDEIMSEQRPKKVRNRTMKTWGKSKYKDTVAKVFSSFFEAFKKATMTGAQEARTALKELR